jgi:hypothetical protein
VIIHRLIDSHVRQLRQYPRLGLQVGVQEDLKCPFGCWVIRLQDEPPCSAQHEQELIHHHLRPRRDRSALNQGTRAIQPTLHSDVGRFPQPLHDGPERLAIGVNVDRPLRVEQIFRSRLEWG